MQHIRLLILDLDYVVFDCASVKAHALKQCMAALDDSVLSGVQRPGGVNVEEEFLHHGFQWMQFLEIGLDEEEQDQLQQAYAILEARILESGAGRIHPGIEEFVVRCRQSNLAVSLGADARRDYMLAVIDRHELDRVFQFALCTEEFGAGSAVEMLEEIMRQAEVNPSETLALGTRPNFFRAAKSLDVRTIGCGWGIRNREVLASADFQSLTVEELLPVIQKFDALAANL